MVMGDTVVDCDAFPSVPDAKWSVADHRRCGRFVFNSSDFQLHLSPNQERGPVIGGELSKEVGGLLVQNARLFEFLRDNPYLYPSEWKRREGVTCTVIFWGTTFNNGQGKLCVGCLTPERNVLRADYYPLHRMFTAHDYALIRKV